MHDATASRKSTDRPSALPILALIVANIALAFGPWFVRLADVGPVAAGFWRLTLAVPLLFAGAIAGGWRPRAMRSEEHTSELQSLMRISYAVFCLKKKTSTK